MIRNNLREQALQGTKQMSSLFETNPEIVAMIKPFTVEFRMTYREAFQLFIDGQWGQAHSKFLETISILK